MGQFEKGNPKPKNSGRKKGTANKTPNEVREVLACIVSKELDKIPTKLAEIDNPSVYVDALSKLLKYVLPSLQAVEMTDNTEAKKAQQELLAKLNKHLT